MDQYLTLCDKSFSGAAIALTSCSFSGKKEIQNACISALAVYPGPQTLEILKKEISSKNWYVRHNAAKSLAVLNTDRDALADILQGNDRYAKEMLEYQLDAAKAQRRAGL